MYPHFSLAKCPFLNPVLTRMARLDALALRRDTCCPNWILVSKEEGRGPPPLAIRPQPQRTHQEQWSYRLGDKPRPARSRELRTSAASSEVWGCQYPHAAVRNRRLSMEHTICVVKPQSVVNVS